MTTGTTRARVGRRGFTLIELLVVVAMIGVLAAIAIVGYRKYLDSARTGDAKALISSIRVAQESVRAETLSYMDCGATWYPNVGGPTGNKFHFHNPGHPRYNDCWHPLNVITDSPTTFTFATQDAAPGQAYPAAIDPNWSNWPAFPAQAVEPSFVIEAVGDADEDGVHSRFMTSSLNGEIFVEAEDE
jgi:type IV pilus assembly protein PilA